MKTYSVYEKPLVGNHGGRHCKNFLKKEFWHVKLFLVKHNSIFGVGYQNREDDIFAFTEV